MVYPAQFIQIARAVHQRLGKRCFARIHVGKDPDRYFFHIVTPIVLHDNFIISQKKQKQKPEIGFCFLMDILY